MSNLSEEERKKAYEFLQELEKNGYRYTADGREIYIVENVFNKIDRLQKEFKDLELAYGLYKDRYETLQKENEELKEQNFKYTCDIALLKTDIIHSMGYQTANAQWRDKIKDKMKELDNSINELLDTEDYNKMYAIKILKELLEE